MISKSMTSNLKNPQFHANLIRLGNIAHGQRTFSTPASNDKVLYNALTPAVTEVILNAPKALNSLDLDMVMSLKYKMQDWHNKPKEAPRCVIMRGSGEKAFCAGGDIKYLYNAKMNGQYDVLRNFFMKEYQADFFIADMRPKQISFWNGIVMGGGVGVSAHSKIRIATENSVYAMPESGIGFFTDVGGSYFLSHLKGNVSIGLFLGITGYRLKSMDLVKWGVATHYFPAASINALYDKLVAEVTVGMTDDQIRQIVDSLSDHQFDEEVLPNIEEINHVFQPDSIQNVVKRIESSTTDFGKQLQKSISRASPLSMAVIFEQIVRGQKLTLREAFEMEFKISQQFMAGDEFFEGVRALLVDKDNAPKWGHKHVNEVPREEVEAYFNRDDKLELDIEKA